MANFSITVTNTLDFFGPSYPTIWNDFTWNSANWGQSADLGVTATHAIDSTVTPDSDVVKYAFHVIDETLAPDSDVLRTASITIENTLSITADMYLEALSDGAGYNYVYPYNATNAEDRDFADWAAAAGQSTTWASSTANSTTWSAA